MKKFYSFAQWAVPVLVLVVGFWYIADQSGRAKGSAEWSSVRADDAREYLRLSEKRLEEVRTNAAQVDNDLRATRQLADRTRDAVRTVTVTVTITGEGQAAEKVAALIAKRVRDGQGEVTLSPAN